MSKTFFITTPIYYINATPHIGHAYTQIAADARARFERLRGRQVYFLTGTDEHGVKVARAAGDLGRDAQDHADELSAQFRALWDQLGITYDDYIRTTQPRHKQVAQAVIEKLWNSGHLTLGTYSGWYSVPDETFFRTEDTVERDGSHYIANPTEDQSKAPLEWVEETTHFFQLSQFQETLLAYYAEHPETLEPDARRNETLAYLNGGLRDASVTRELDWGVAVPATVPHHEKHSIYVWFEALINYLSAPGYLSDDAERRAHFDTVWPPDLQLMSKDIFTRFHATMWPAMLTALDLPLPAHLFAHGFWTVDGRKMSKRDPETIVEPIEFATEMATAANCELTTTIDALRYYCLREVTFGSDGDFSRDGCIARYNSDLANGLGNLVNRALSMLQQYFQGTVPEAIGSVGLRATLKEASAKVEIDYENLDFSNALQQVWTVISHANQVIEEQKPWAKIKQGDRENVAILLVELLAVCQWSAIVLHPVMPHVTQKIQELLALDGKLEWADTGRELLTPGHKCLAPSPLFPRISKPVATKPVTKIKENIMSTNEAPNSAPTEGVATTTEAGPAAPASEVPAAESAAPATAEAVSAEAASAPAAPEEKALIEYGDFAKIDLRVATIVEAEKVPKADKLLKLQVDLGTERRQILAGIAQQYEPEQLIGRQVIVVANLAPRKLRGLESQGMLLAASLSPEAPPAALLTVGNPVEPGSYVR